MIILISQQQDQQIAKARNTIPPYPLIGWVAWACCTSLIAAKSPEDVFIPAVLISASTDILITIFFMRLHSVSFNRGNQDRKTCKETY